MTPQTNYNPYRNHEAQMIEEAIGEFKKQGPTMLKYFSKAVQSVLIAKAIDAMMPNSGRLATSLTFLVVNDGLAFLEHPKEYTEVVKMTKKLLKEAREERARLRRLRRYAGGDIEGAEKAFRDAQITDILKTDSLLKSPDDIATMNDAELIKAFQDVKDSLGSDTAKG